VVKIIAENSTDIRQIQGLIAVTPLAVVQELVLVMTGPIVQVLTHVMKERAIVILIETAELDWFVGTITVELYMGIRPLKKLIVASDQIQNGIHGVDGVAALEDVEEEQGQEDEDVMEIIVRGHLQIQSHATQIDVQVMRGTLTTLAII